MKAYFLLLFGMLWSDLGSIKSGFFFNTQANRKKHWKKTISSNHDATCNVGYRTAVALSKLLTPLHCYTLPQHPKVLKSNWNIPFIVMIINTYFLCTVGKWTFRISYFSFQSSYSFFSVKRGGVVLHILRQPDLSHFLSWKSTILFIFCKEASSRPRLCVLFWSKGGGPVFNQMAIQSFQTFVADCDCDLMYCI